MMDKEVIKRFVDLMETVIENADEHSGCSLDLYVKPDESSLLRDEGARIAINRLGNRAEYQALKALVSPATPDKRTFADFVKDSQMMRARCGINDAMLGKPKKQTLEEFCIKNAPYGNLETLTPSEIIYLISEYINHLKNNGI